MNTFRTAWNRGETTQTEIGSPIANTYGYRIDKNTGKRIITKTGETNIYEKIQAAHEGTKIEKIIERVTGGDLTPLQIREGSYIDISEIPTNMIELQNTIYKAKEEFKKLPKEIKEKFENSAEKYISMYGSKEWYDTITPPKKIEPNERVKEEIKEVKTNE